MRTRGKATGVAVAAILALAAGVVQADGTPSPDVDALHAQLRRQAPEAPELQGAEMVRVYVAETRVAEGMERSSTVAVRDGDGWRVSQVRERLYTQPSTRRAPDGPVELTFPADMGVHSREWRMSAEQGAALKKLLDQPCLRGEGLACASRPVVCNDPPALEVEIRSRGERRMESVRCGEPGLYGQVAAAVLAGPDALAAAQNP